MDEHGSLGACNCIVYLDLKGGFFMLALLWKTSPMPVRRLGYCLVQSTDLSAENVRWDW